jgi:Arrestin (or S-antigen), N-terminal domain
VGQEEELFLNVTKPIWTPASSSEGKVVGQHTFPFSIVIPRDVMIAPVPKAAPKSFPLPPTFSERASPAYIDYRLFVTVRRGRLRVNKQCVRALHSIHVFTGNNTFD